METELLAHAGLRCGAAKHFAFSEGDFAASRGGQNEELVQSNQGNGPAPERGFGGS